MEDVSTPTNSDVNLEDFDDEKSTISLSDIHHTHSSSTITASPPHHQGETVIETAYLDESSILPFQVLSYPPPHPEARGVKSTTPSPYDVTSHTHEAVDMFKEYRQNYKRSPSPSGRSSSRSGVTTPGPPPVVINAPPPYKHSLSNYSSGSTSSLLQEIEEADGNGASSKRTVRVNFQVKVPKEMIKDKEEVRITGNVTSLGKWNVFQSVTLSKNTDLEDTWSRELEISSDLPIKYRYLIVERVRGCGSTSESTNETAINIVSWETFLHPRQCSFRRPKSPNDSVLNTETGEYGIFEDGGQVVLDDGWLVGVSELHLQLGTCCKPISIDTLPEDTQFSVKIQPFCSSAKKDVVHSPIKAKKLSRVEGDCTRLEQGESGCRFDQNINLLVFHTQSPDFSHCGFTIDIYTVLPKTKITPGKKNPEPVEVIVSRVGRASLLPQQYMSKPEVTQGKVILTVFSSELLPIGTITFTYLLIHPVKESPLVHKTKHSYSTYWKKHKRMLHIGHRGLGDSYHLAGDIKPTVTENTVSSLKLAGGHGADYVEFDVQLTKDHIPIVYHNFEVCTTLAREGFFSGELYEMFVKDLTLHQLQSLKLDHSSVMEKNLGLLDDQGSPVSSASESYDSPNETAWGAKRGASYRENLPERKTFPTLKTLFQKLPNHIGFNLEVKFPVPEKDKDGVLSHNFSYFDNNVVADAILKVVYRHARGRKMMFTCFDPDMCTVLRRKQPKYPVMVLTSSLNPKHGVPVDVRGHTVHDAMMHARAEKLLGIVSNSTPLLSDRHLIQQVKERQLVLFTWGHENNDVKNIEIQKKAGVDAVIYDCINVLLPGPQKNVFQVEEEEERRTTLRYWQDRKEKQDSEKQSN